MTLAEEILNRTFGEKKRKRLYERYPFLSLMNQKDSYENRSPSVYNASDMSLSMTNNRIYPKSMSPSRDITPGGNKSQFMNINSSIKSVHFNISKLKENSESNNT